MSPSFKDHPLTDAERLWLEAVYEDGLLFDPKIAKVRLHDKLPKGFDPKKIDGRFLLNGKKLTFLGICRIHPEAPIVGNVERVIRKIRDLILEQPGIETFTAESLSNMLGIEKTEVGKVLEHISTFGGFYSQASGRSDLTGYSSITLIGDDAYDAYVDFESLESLMEQYYQSRADTSEGSGTRIVSGLGTVVSLPAWGSSDYIYYPQLPAVQHVIKTDTAFILMPMDRENAELEDVYETIKQTCASFRIHAYRADEVQHQDRITDLILSEIKQCELLIADLSHERPNVYYEIGYAHALQKRPILYRKHGTRLHFDLSVHNVPEYRNITELKSLLLKRLEAILGRSPTPPSS